MSLQQKVISVLVAIAVFALVIDLVRRKKLTEDLSVIWLLASVAIVLLVLSDKTIHLITRLTGIVAPTSIVFFFGIVFLLLVNLHLSLVISRLKTDVKNLAQEAALGRATEKPAPPKGKELG